MYVTPFLALFYRQKKGRMNSNGARKGTTMRDPPQVKTDIIMAPTMMQRMESETMKQPPRTRTVAWMVASLRMLYLANDDDDDDDASLPTARSTTTRGLPP